MGVATAILALTFPRVHAVVDFRVWKVVFGEDKTTFTANDYITYLKKIRLFAGRCRWSVQKADCMVWSYYDTRPN